MVEPADCANLVLESLDANLVLAVRGQHLERNDLSQLDMSGLVHGPHTALPELFQDFVLADAPVLEPRDAGVRRIGRSTARISSRRGRLAKPAQELGGRLRPLSLFRRSENRWTNRRAHQSVESLLASRTVFDVELDSLTLRGAELLGQQPFQFVGRGTWSLVAGHEESSSTCEARRAGSKR